MSAEERALVAQALALVSEHHKNRDMIDVGAYRPGTHAELDRAVRAMPAIERLLRQDMRESVSRADALRQLRAALDTTRGQA